MNKKKTIIRSLKNSADAIAEANPQAHRKIMKQAGQHSCAICGPWCGENKVMRKAGKRGAKKPKNKHKFKR